MATRLPNRAVHALHAPDGGLVHDVVVVQRGQVDQLHRHRPQEVVPAWPAAGGRRGRGQHGRSRFPPAAIRWVVTSLERVPVTTDSWQGLEPGQVALRRAGQAEGLDDVHFPQT